MKKAIIVVAAVLVIVVGGALAAVYIMMDKIIKTGIETVGPEATGVSVTVDSVDISPFSGTFGLNTFTMGNPSGFTADHSLAVRRFRIEVDPASLLKDVVIVREVTIEGAAVTWEELRGDNHQQIMKNIESYTERFKKPGEKPAEAPPEDKKPGKKVIIRNVYLKDGSLDFVASGKKLVTIPLPDLHLTGIGEKSGGETAGEAIRQIYRQVYTAAARSATENTALFREKLGELEKRGREIIDKSGGNLEDIKKGVEDLFK
ncbi:MAG: hypothetical protein AVO39_00615 [delta proteobacterium MLS_D]|jgi:uncharacterized protein involved in outer membrane biogenesis|nr:MAG: hypothetical protein AVO39_00615 [delta proteobacterium MLS_D]